MYISTQYEFYLGNEPYLCAFCAISHPLCTVIRSKKLLITLEKYRSPSTCGYTCREKHEKYFQRGAKSSANLPFTLSAYFSFVLVYFSRGLFKSVSYLTMIPFLTLLYRLCAPSIPTFLERKLLIFLYVVER